MNDEDKPLAKTNSVLLPHVVPLILVPNRNETESILFSGSGALVDTGKKRLLVTCHHVWDRFREEVELHPEMRAAVIVGQGPAWVINDLPLLGHSKRLDLSVLDLDRSELGDHLRNRFATVQPWPPERVKTGDSVAVIGFPSSDKEKIPDENGIGLISYFSTSLMFVASSVSDQKIVLADTDDSRREILFQGRPLDTSFSFGGMSGCPAFVSRGGRFDFAGIMFEGPHTDPKGTFFIAHAAFIDENGQINWSEAPFA